MEAMESVPSRKDTHGMQTDLSYLPDDKRRELEEIVKIIRARADVEMVILYGSYARGEWKEEKDLDPARWSGHVSDYDILIVVDDQAKAENSLLWKEVDEALDAADFSAHPRPIVRDVNEINMALSESRYFFIDLAKEGRLLYDAGRVKLGEPGELGPADRQRLAQEYFNVWSEAAREHFDHFEYALSKDDLRRAAFNLNQATESAYKCILLVFTLYNPHEHLLSLLGRMAGRHAPVFEAIFPQDTTEHRHYFDQLDRAYIGSRYHPRFKVTREELDYLAPRVAELLAVTEKICREEIARKGQST